MANYDNLPERSRKAINYVQSWTEKEKTLLHRALDAVVDEAKAYTDTEITTVESSITSFKSGLDSYFEALLPYVFGVQHPSGTWGTADPREGNTFVWSDESGSGPHTITLPRANRSEVFSNGPAGQGYSDYPGPPSYVFVNSTSATAVTVSVDAGDTVYLNSVSQGLGNGFSLSAGEWALICPQPGLDAFTVFKPAAGGGGGASDFTDLGDTPGTLGTAGQLLRMNGGATALEFFTEDFLSNVSEDTTPQLGGNLDVNGNAIVSTGGADISITPDGAGAIVLDSLRWPTADGSADQVLKTDGSGNLSWVANAGSGLANVVDDTTPQLGGNLDVNGNSIVSVANGDIAITPNGTGSVVLDGLNWPQSDGTNGQILQTNGAGQLGWTSAGAGSSTFLGLSDTPGSFSASQWVRVNSGATDLEFVSPPVQSVTSSGAINHSGTTSVVISIDAASGSGPGTMSAADFLKLAGIETSADVTDATNVAAAGAVMDSDFSGSSGYLYKTGAGAYALRQITPQSGGTPSGGADGDIILIY